VPVWLISAIQLIRTAIGGVARRVPRGALTAGAGAAGGVALADPAGGLLPNIFGDEGRPRRRRRRRALTASDRADIAFISGTLGKAAGDRFAVSLVAGLTR